MVLAKFYSLYAIGLLFSASLILAKPPNFNQSSEERKRAFGGGPMFPGLDGGEILLRPLHRNGKPRDFLRISRGLDSLSGSAFGMAKRGKLDSLSGMAFGNTKRHIDEIDRTSFDAFSKRNFDEIDRSDFDRFFKKRSSEHSSEENYQ